MQGRTTLRVLLGASVLLTVPLAGCLGIGADPTTPPVVPPDGGEVDDGNGTIWDNETVIDVGDKELHDNSTIHPHDYWLGRHEVTIVDERVDIDWTAELQNDPQMLTRPWWMVDVEPEETPDGFVPKFVFPGTGQINVTLEWEGGDGAKRVCVTNAAASGILCGDSDDERRQEHWFEASSDTWTIDGNTSNGNFLTRETLDPPHAIKSDWRFQVWMCAGGDGAEQADLCPADLTASSFRLTVTVVRGPDDLPIDPPHFAFYGDQDRLLVMRWSQSQVPFQSNWLGQAVGQAQGDSRPYVQFNGFRITTDNRIESDVPVVAWETGELEVTVTARSANDVPIQFKYRTAADPWEAPWKDGGDPCTDQCTFTVPVTQIETDSPYAHQTQWEFALFPADPPAQPMVQYELGLEIWGINRRAG